MEKWLLDLSEMGLENALKNLGNFPCPPKRRVYELRGKSGTQFLDESYFFKGDEKMKPIDYVISGRGFETSKGERGIFIASETGLKLLFDNELYDNFDELDLDENLKLKHLEWVEEDYTIEKIFVLKESDYNMHNWHNWNNIKWQREKEMRFSEDMINFCKHCLSLSLKWITRDKLRGFLTWLEKPEITGDDCWLGSVYNCLVLNESHNPEELFGFMEEPEILDLEKLVEEWENEDEN